MSTEMTIRVGPGGQQHANVGVGDKVRLSIELKGTGAPWFTDAGLPVAVLSQMSCWHDVGILPARRMLNDPLPENFGYDFWPNEHNSVTLVNQINPAWTDAEGREGISYTAGRGPAYPKLVQSQGVLTMLADIYWDAIQVGTSQIFVRGWVMNQFGTRTGFGDTLPVTIIVA